MGAKVGVAADAPCLDAAYKHVEYDGRPVMKLSSAKVTAPGRKQVFHRAGRPDVIALGGGGTPGLRSATVADDHARRAAGAVAGPPAGRP
ncbi:hypothetical protein ACE1SV_04620 [Streptomyces sp. E-15]